MINSKKGSSAVFLAVILAALVSITMALIYGVREESVRSRVDAVVNLAGDSVMSEFDYNVQKDYGLFMLKGTDEELTDKFNRYIDYSLDDMKQVEVQSSDVSGSRFSVADIKLVKNQLLEHIKYVETLGLFKKTSQDSTVENNIPKRTLNHGPTITSLPSIHIPDKNFSESVQSISDNASNIGNIFKPGTDSYLLNRYILNIFNNKVTVNSTSHFFSNEAEYIFGGKMSDEENEKNVESALKKLRFTLNVAHIYADAEKRTAVTAMAQAVMPGIAASAAQALIASAWAFAEADNDVELLWQGYKVPLIKDKSSWAINLENAVEDNFRIPVKPDVNKGYDYGQYLQMLLFFQDENLKIARILDLIQINMRMACDKDFIVQEYAMGVVIDVKVNGRNYVYEKKY